MLARVLVVENDALQRETLAMSLSLEGYRPILAESPEDALRCLETQAIDLVLCSLEIQDVNGRELMPALTRWAPTLPIILTADADRTKLASAAIERGAYGALQKPVERAELVLLLQRAQDLKQLHSRNRSLEREVERQLDYPIVAASEPMIELLEIVEQATDQSDPVLITGESGTGKESIARVLHAQSGRSHAPFLFVDCRSLSDEPFFEEALAPSSRTSESADAPSSAAGGSIYLDQVAALSLEAQARLLELLQKNVRNRRNQDPLQQSTDIRWMASSSDDLDKAIETGRFRRDLADALGPIRLDVPSLRERQPDLPLLVDHLFRQWGPRLAPRLRGFSEEALAHLSRYSWPGNLRELENLVLRTLTLTREERITRVSLPGDLLDEGFGQVADPDSPSFSLKTARKAFETELIRTALRVNNANRTHAAKQLKISHRALLYKIKEYGIQD
ncbi:sigma-54 dependent transcriptional regulator [Myxococcota bacterium]|nr:sigma-54 dependent transcriptional regulator [Myxococcota bacterium]